MKSKCKCFIQLGRTGDILNALPLAKQHFDQTGEKPLFMAALEFASVLEGVSYVIPFVYYGPWDLIHAAIFEAQKVTSNITVCQIHGNGWISTRLTSSFARESWLSAGATVPWGSLPLVFDQRNKEREQKLIEKFWAYPLILFAGEGKSSPFPHTKPLLEALQKKFGPKVVPLHDQYGVGVKGARVTFPTSANVVDLSTVKAERFFDLLGLFERASVLIAIDTAHQHLAAAVPTLPVIAIRTSSPDPWHGSPWRPEHVMSIFYDEFPTKMDEVVEAVNALVNIPVYRPKIIHTWADWLPGEATDETKRRCAVAAASWDQEYATGRWVKCKVGREEGMRDGTDIGDQNAIQYMKDLVERAVSLSCYGQDIIALTNADIGFTPGLTGRVFQAVGTSGAVYTHRRDFHTVIPAAFVSEAQANGGQFYPGSDAFFFTVDWWKAHGAEYGDYLMGREFWDEAFRQLIKWHGGVELPNAVWHEWHDSFWCGKLRPVLAGNLHNHGLRQEWFNKTGLKPEDFRWWQCTYESCGHPQPVL